MLGIYYTWWKVSIDDECWPWKVSSGKTSCDTRCLQKMASRLNQQRPMHWSVQKVPYCWKSPRMVSSAGFPTWHSNSQLNWNVSPCGICAVFLGYLFKNFPCGTMFLESSPTRYIRCGTLEACYWSVQTWGWCEHQTCRLSAHSPYDMVCNDPVSFTAGHAVKQPHNHNATPCGNANCGQQGWHIIMYIPTVPIYMG